MENTIGLEFEESNSEIISSELTPMEEFYKDIAIDGLKNLVYTTGVFFTISQIIILSTILAASIYYEENWFSKISPEFYSEVSSYLPPIGIVTLTSVQVLLLAFNRDGMRIFKYPEELRKFSNFLKEVERIEIPIPQQKHSAKPLVELGRLIHSRRNNKINKYE